MYTVTQKINTEVTPNLIAVDSVKNLMYIVGTSPGVLNVVNLIDQSVLDRVVFPQNIQDIALSSLNKKLFVIANSSMFIYDVSYQSSKEVTLLEEIPLTNEITHIKIDVAKTQEIPYWIEAINLFYNGGFYVYNTYNNELVSDLTIPEDCIFGKIFDSRQLTTSTTTPAPTIQKYLYGINSHGAGENGNGSISIYDTSLLNDPSGPSVSTAGVLGRSPQKIVLNNKTKLAYITNYYDEHINVVDLANQNYLYGTINVDKGVSALAIDEEHNLLYIVNNLLDTLTVLDLNTNTVIETIKTLEFPTDIVIDILSQKIIISHKDLPVLLIINSVDFSHSTFSLSFIPHSITIDSLSHVVYLSDSDNHRVYRYYIDKNAVFFLNQNLIGSPQDIVFYQSKNLLVFISMYNDTIVFFDPQKLTIVGRVKLENNPNSIAIDEDSGFAYISHRLINQITVVDTNRFTIKTTLPCGDAPVDLLVFNPNTTTTTTLAPVTTDVVLTVPDGDVNYDAENFVTFYGNDGDVLMYEKIDTLASVTLYELFIRRPSDDEVINRITFPAQYAETGRDFIIKTENGAKRYQSSFLGAWVTDTDGSNRHMIVTVTDIGTTPQPPQPS